MTRILWGGVLFVFLWPAGTAAQNPPAKPAAAPVAQKGAAPVQGKSSEPGMTNADVIKMVKAGVSEDVVIAAIKGAARKSFDLSPEGLKALKSAGVSDTIATAMSANQPVPAPAPAPPTAAPAATVSAADPGFYLAVGAKQFLLESSPIVQGRTGMKDLVLGGAVGKARTMAVIARAHAAVVVPPDVEILFVPGGGLTQPGEISLVVLTPEGDTRRFQLGEVGAFSGTKVRLTTDELVPITFEQVAPDTFRILTGGPLKPGEYAFVAPSMVDVGLKSATGRVFDFSVAK